MNQSKVEIVAPPDIRQEFPQLYQPKLHVVRRAVEGLPDAQIERFVNFGKRKADLIAEMKEAERVGDLNLAMQIAKTLCDIDDQLTPKCRALNP